MCATPYVPESIVVHLGRPADPAANVTVSFPDYIKNVASSEIYPTWPETAIRANIYAQVSFALNRIYTEWYRSQGYPFQITSSTAYDQAYQQGRDIFENVARLVDELFNDYIRRIGFTEPLLAQYCNGTTVTCNGLSQWGTVPLAKQGLTPFNILTYYYGNNIELVRNAPIAPNVPSYPGILRLGSRGGAVRAIQLRLNRIAQNYPAIPRLANVDGIFGPRTESAVRTFQKVFRLAQDGIVGKQTWYRLIYIYTSVKRLAALDSEGEKVFGKSAQFVTNLSFGDTGDLVLVLQYFLLVVSEFNQSIPTLELTGTFDSATQQAVEAFQRSLGLTVDGIVGKGTWEALYDSYRGIIDTIPIEYRSEITATPPAETLTFGMRNSNVRQLQIYLQGLANAYPNFPVVNINGQYGNLTRTAVAFFQRRFGLEPTGNADPETWRRLVQVYRDILYNPPTRRGQFPGETLREGSTDFSTEGGT